MRYGWRRTTGGVLGYPIGRFGYPVVPLRLYLGLLFMLPFFSFLAVVAHLRFNWFTFYRQLYLLAGVLAGILGGYTEAFLISEKLKKNVEVVAWFLIPFGLAVWFVPTALVYLFMGADEFLPFAAYFILPSAAIAAITSGYKFRSFEKKAGVRVFAFFLTRYVPYPKYWIETPETLELELYGFLEAIGTNDAFWMLYYGKYAQQLKKLVEKLSQRGDKLGRRISRIKEPTSKLLDEIMRFNREQRRVLMPFGIGTILWMASIFFAAANNYLETLLEYGRHVYFTVVIMPLLLIFGYALVKRRSLLRSYERNIKMRLNEIDIESKIIIKDVMKLLTTEKHS